MKTKNKWDSWDTEGPKMLFIWEGSLPYGIQTRVNSLKIGKLSCL